MEKLIKENRVAIGLLIIWAFINLILFMLSNPVSENEARENLFPFTELEFTASYDITEFVIYGVGPAIIFIVLKLMNDEKK